MPVESEPSSAPEPANPNPGTPSSTGELWQVGDWQLDAATGEMRSLDGARSRRLAPQPARLLALLIERRGEIVSRQEIRHHLWPDVEVDFEQGLHFCIRQVRTALGDDASAPRYVETLPRRGYRLIAEVERVAGRAPIEGVSETVSEPTSQGEPAAEEPGRGSIPPLAIALLAVLMGVAVGAWLLGATSRDRESDRVASSSSAKAPKLAIMVFDPPAAIEASGVRYLSELLLVRFGRLGAERLAVVGPTTTSAYTTDLRSVSRLIAEKGMDYVLNGRFIEADDGRVDLVVELIRGTDEAHVWVVRFVDLSDGEAMADRVEEGVLGALGLGP